MTEPINAVITLIQTSAIAQVWCFFILWLVAWLPMAIPLALKLHWRPFQVSQPNQKLPLLACLYLLVPLLLPLFSQWLGQSLGEYGLTTERSFWVSLLAGLVIGVGGIGLLVGVEVALGWATWRPLPESADLTPQSEPSPHPMSSVLGVVLPILLLALWVSVTEELVFRGFLLNQLLGVYGAWGAAAIASLVFAVLHTVWDAWSRVAPQLPGLWVMGMVLVLARWLDSGSLGLACGLHAGWVWAIASLDSLQGLGYTGRVSPWVTGWGNSPLAGVMGISFLLVTTVGLLLLF